MDKIKLKNIVEAILMASDRVLTLAQIEKMLTEKTVASKKNKPEEVVKEPEAVAANDSSNESETEAVVSSDEEQAETVAEEAEAEAEAEAEGSVSLKNLIKEVIQNLQQDYSGRAMELKEVASGFRFQVRQEYADHVGKLWEERPSKYSRALLETLVLIAYRQPITRGEIEAIRGVRVSSHIIKTLVEREWVRVIGHRDVPGKPAIYGSTKEFLDYFNLKSLDELPSLAEIKDLDKIAAPELALSDKDEQTTVSEGQGTESEVVDTDSVRKKIEIRRMRRLRRMSRMSDKNTQSDETANNEQAASQEIESEQAEIS